MKKNIICLFVFLLLTNAVYSKNKDFWETKYTPTRIEYLSDNMFLFNESLKQHLPPKTEYFFCHIIYNTPSEEYRLYCTLKTSSTYITQKTLFPFYKNIESSVSQMMDCSSANINKQWSNNLPIILNVDNVVRNEQFTIDKNTYK